jgi:hypothetical protein
MKPLWPFPDSDPSAPGHMDYILLIGDSEVARMLIGKGIKSAYGEH